jgi:hypothetical protein
MRWRAEWGEAVMVRGLGRGCFWWVDVKWLRVFGRYNAVQCKARGVCLTACVTRGSVV